MDVFSPPFELAKMYYNFFQMGDLSDLIHGLFTRISITSPIVGIAGQTNAPYDPPFHKEHNNTIIIGMKYRLGRLQHSFNSIVEFFIFIFCNSILQDNYCPQSFHEIGGSHLAHNLGIHSSLGAALENFPAQKQKKGWFHVCKKKETKNMSQRTTRANSC